MIKVVHVCNTDIKGGAARAAYALNSALKQVGVDSKMLVQRKFGNNPDVYSVSESTLDKQLTNYRMILDLIPMHLFTKKDKGRFSFGKTGINISSQKIIREADIIHLHWINEGFLSLNNIKRLAELRKPIVWTFHDMWAFTGGCHYSAGCERYKELCGNCHYLKSPSENDFSEIQLKNKKEIFDNINLTLVTPSTWMRDCAKNSYPFRNKEIKIIPYAIDQKLFCIGDKVKARRVFGINPEKIIILFGTMDVKDERKGFRLFKESLIQLDLFSPELRNKIELAVFGKYTEEIASGIPYKINFLGLLKDERLVLSYNSADVFIAPSIEDNYPNTVMESLACGVPVIAFNIGGMPDMIINNWNGLLVSKVTSNDLYTTIRWAIRNNDDLKTYGLNARNKILQTNLPEKIGNKYLELYRKLL